MTSNEQLHISGRHEELRATYADLVKFYDWALTTDAGEASPRREIFIGFREEINALAEGAAYTDYNVLALRHAERHLALGYVPDEDWDLPDTTTTKQGKTAVALLAAKMEGPAQSSSRAVINAVARLKRGEVPTDPYGFALLAILQEEITLTTGPILSGEELQALMLVKGPQPIRE